MRNYRFKFTIALGIGAICGMLWTPVKLVHAEQQTSNIIAETEADQEPAAGYVKIEENSSGPELYSDYDIAMYNTERNMGEYIMEPFRYHAYDIRKWRYAGC